MCGIAGLFSPRPDSIPLSRLVRMGRLMAHRGPDDEGFLLAGLDGEGWVRRYQPPANLLDGGGKPFEAPARLLDEWSADSATLMPQVAFAHRRLRIIDLHGGRQPLSSPGGAVWVCYNGEVYNYKELRSELEGKGHRFRTRSDTEVLACAYETWGEESFGRLNGIFAFALLDRLRARVYLVRDQLGAKPLYYARLRSGGVAFASEYKALLEVPDLDRGLDYVALAEHFTFQNTLGDRSFLAGVKLLPAGHFIILDREAFQQRSYFDLRYHLAPAPYLTDREWAVELRETFEASVRRQLVSDVPLGCFLSGGMDTSSIAAVAARHVRPLHTFNCGFDTTGVSEPERAFDESDAALAMSKALGTRHHSLVLGPGDMERALQSVVWHLDEPRVGISYQVHCTSALVRQWVTVVLSGVGGDELFGGYPWRYRPVAQLRDPAAFQEEYFRLWHRMVPPGELAGFFTPQAFSMLGGFSPRDSFGEVLSGAPVDWDPLHRAMYFDAKTFLNGLLVVDDKLNMAHSVEGRVPLLDLEMIDLASRMPARLKLDAERTKIVLREAMAALIPERILARPKVGFTPPDATWYRTAAAHTVEDLVLGKRALARGLFEPGYLRRVWQEHLSGAANHRFLLWSLMCFEVWCRLFLDGERSGAVELRFPGREP